ncbi:response regulator [Alteromonas oceanisediminis]|uniref:response regulator n=1 Tax=Alteromonas oceanisediminis TaxID=2836180 RepID=UPI001BDB402C|nr:response regulator [Alteromonas oceanisediminis]MBT0585372.1 response regulator [Alteromonas oceanisediminis]
MTTNILICDDSGFARKQMARSIPDGWDVEISFAEHGQQAIELIKQGKGDVLFLDLNMPVMDGYQTMQVIRSEDLPTLVIVVSGDVQPEARSRMVGMGALDFIRKPIDNAKLTTILSQYGLYSGAPEATQRSTTTTNVAPQSTQRVSKADDKIDAYRELVNVAMGRAGESLANLFGEFIDLPIPNVNVLETTELHMAIAEVQRNASISAVSKGFVSAGITGEALVLFDDESVDSMIELLKYDEVEVTEQLELEAFMDVSNILIGACLNALSEQLNVKFSHNHPIILGRHCDLDVLLDGTVSRWNKIMAIEICYAIKKHDLTFDLLLLIPGSAMEQVYTRLVDTTEARI